MALHKLAALLGVLAYSWLVACGAAVAAPTINAPSVVNLGAIPAGTLRSRKVTFRLSAGKKAAPATITGLETASPFSVDDAASTCHDGTILSPGKACFAVVTFAPNARGAVTGTLHLTTSGPSANVTLLGKGIEKPLGISGWTFTATPVNLFVLGGVDIHNPNLVPVTIGSIVSTVSMFQPLLDGCTKIAPGASCTQDIVFVPTLEGKIRGTLQVTSDATGKPQTAKLIGTGQAPVGDISFAELEHATVQLGLSMRATVTALQVQSLLIGNTGAVSAGVCSPMMNSGSYKLEFNSPPPLNQSVAATIYYDAACSQPYIESTITFTAASPTDREATEDFTYLKGDGSVIGTQTMTSAFQLSDYHGGEWNFGGLATFSPVQGNHPVQFGFACEILVDGTEFQCQEAAAQDVTSLGNEIGWYVMLSKTGDVLGGNEAIMGSGPFDSIFISTDLPISADSVRMSAPEAPAGATGYGGQFHPISVFPDYSFWQMGATGFHGNIIGADFEQFSDQTSVSIELNVNSALIATATLDRSGSGTIRYSDGTEQSIAAWMLVD